MIISELLKTRALSSKQSRLKKLEELKDKYSHQYQHSLGILKTKSEIMFSDLQKDKEDIFKNSFENHLVSYIVNNTKPNKSEFESLEQKLKQKALSRYETHKKAVEQNFKEENKDIIKRINSYKKLCDTIESYKSEIAMIKSSSSKPTLKTL